MHQKLPFEEIQIGTRKFFRTFSSHIDSSDLIWHRDAEDRLIHVLESDGWYMQLDDQLPILLETGSNYYIKKHEWHRVIRTKDCNELKIIVQKL